MLAPCLAPECQAASAILLQPLTFNAQRTQSTVVLAEVI